MVVLVCRNAGIRRAFAALLVAAGGACGAHATARPGTIGLSCHALPLTASPGTPGEAVAPDCAHARRVVMARPRFVPLVFTRAYLVLPSGNSVAVPADQLPALLAGRLYVDLPAGVTGGVVRLGSAPPGESTPFTLE
jgi:hypothetical protein